jgi:N6-L-threonylcarbamoyladenine synthase
MIVLGIESSCDDTAAAVVQDGRILSNVVHSQVEHSPQGGIVPELASRLHQQQISRVVEKALSLAGVEPSQLDGIAYTAGPGLMGALLVGSSFAKAYSQALGKPMVAVDHLHGHLMSVFAQPPYPSFPYLCLLVSGGHTLLLQVTDRLTYTRLGSTLDDAAGEAFDKAGRMLGYPYPGGPHIDRAAAAGGNAHFHRWPDPRTGSHDWSFSGLKTAILYHLQRQGPAYLELHRQDLAATIQHTIVAALAARVEQAVAETGIQQVALAGGVAANRGLRSRLQQLADTHGCSLFIPDFQFCTDNAAMIALAGEPLLQRGQLALHTDVPYANHQI